MSDIPRCPNCGGPVVIAHPISSAEPLHICIACSPAEPDKLDLILAELKALRESLTPVDLVTGFADVQQGEAVYLATGELDEPWPPITERAIKLKPSFTPLDTKVMRLVASAAGISLGKALGFSLQFREPGLVVAVVEYHVPADAFAAAVGAISSLPEEQQPEPIGADELGFPIFAEAPIPPEVQSPCAPIAGAAPQSSPSPARP